MINAIPFLLAVSLGILYYIYSKWLLKFSIVYTESQNRKGVHFPWKKPKLRTINEL